MGRLRIAISLEIPDQQMVQGIEWNVVERDIRLELQKLVKRNFGQNKYAFIIFDEIKTIKTDLHKEDDI